MCACTVPLNVPLNTFTSIARRPWISSMAFSLNSQSLQRDNFFNETVFAYYTRSVCNLRQIKRASVSKYDRFAWDFKKVSVSNSKYDRFAWDFGVHNISALCQATANNEKLIQWYRVIGHWPPFEFLRITLWCCHHTIMSLWIADQAAQCQDTSKSLSRKVLTPLRPLLQHSG